MHPAAADPVEQPWNLFTPGQETQLGRELGAFVDARIQRFEDARLTQQLEAVSARLLAVPQTPVPVALHPLAASEAYALGLPGGAIYLSSGLLAQLRCEQDLAGLLAHELAHLELRQLTRRLSQTRRFSIHAALVASDRGEATLLEGLLAIGLDPHPGAPLFHYSAEEEAEALSAAAARLELAGYAPEAAALFHQRLRQGASGEAARYLQRHPPTQTPAAAEIASEGSGPARCTAKRTYRKLTADLQRVSAAAPALDALLAWTAPVPAPQVARSRERLINRSYSFDYPGSWSAANPGPDEYVEVAPKGGRWQPGGRHQPARLVLGLMAGTLEPFEGDLAGDRTLRRHLDALRPGLALAPATAAPALDAPMVYQALYTGTSPAGSEEQVWALSRRLPDRVFYMLLIAPADRAADLQAEFQAIAASIDFPGQPVSGRPPASRPEGANP